jgi:hypothetical protein
MYDSIFYALHSRLNEFFPTGKSSQFQYESTLDPDNEVAVLELVSLGLSIVH